MTPDDYGNPVAGRLLAWSAEEVVLRHEDPSVGAVNLHFPRVGFDVAAEQSARGLATCVSCGSVERRSHVEDTGYYIVAEINASAGSESALRDLLRLPGRRVKSPDAWSAR